MSDELLRHEERDDQPANGDELDFELRSPVEIGTRIIVLASVLRRLTLENTDVGNRDDLSAEAFDEREWLREQGLERALTAREAALLDAPIGSVSPEVIGETSWQGEALVALGWSIGALDMPAVGTASDHRPLIDTVPRPWDGVKDWLKNIASVSESEAARQREIAEIWYWRLTTEILRRAASNDRSHDYEAAVREVAAEALDAGLLPAACAGDFPIFDRSVKDLSQPIVSELIAVTGQRLRGLSWLCGFGRSWDDVPLDV